MPDLVPRGPEAPTYGGPQVTPSALSAPRLSPDMPLAAAGGGPVVAGAFGEAGDLGATVAKLAEAHKQDGDQVAVLDAINKLQTKSTDLMYNPQSGLIGKRGKDAMAASGQVMTDFQKTATDLMGGLANDQQRVAFQHHVVSLGGSLYKDVEVHVGQQSRAYDDETTQSFLKNSQSSAELHYRDEDAIQTSIGQQKAALADFARRNGMPPEWVKEQALNAESKTNSRVIFRMLNNQQDLLAKQYYDDHRDSFTGDDASTVEKALGPQMIIGEARRAADEAVSPKEAARDFSALAPGQRPTQIEPTRQEAMESVRKIENPKVRGMAEELVKAHFVEREQEERQTIAEAFMKASRIINQNAATVKAGTPIETILPADVLQDVSGSPEHLNALRQMAIDRQVSDPVAVMQWSKDASDRAEFGKKDLVQIFSDYGQKLNTADRNALRKQWDESREAYLKNAATPVPPAEIERALQDYLPNFRLNIPWYERGNNQPFEKLTKGIGALSQEDADRFAAVRQEVTRIAQMEKNTKGRPLNSDEITGIIDKTMRKQVEVYKTSFMSTSFLPWKWGEEPAGKNPYDVARQQPGVMKPYAMVLLDKEHIELSDDHRKDLVDIINRTKGSDLDWKTISKDDRRLQMMYRAYVAGDKDLVTRIASQ